MSFQITVESNVDSVADLLQAVSQKVLPSESAKGLNRTITFVRNEVSAEVSQRTGLPKALIKRRVKGIRNRRASPQRLAARGFVGEFDVPVSQGRPRPRRTGQGVTYKTLPNSPHDPKAFFARMPSGKRSAWVRKGSARLPVQEKTLRIQPYLRRSTRRVIRGPAANYFDRVLTDNMEKRMNREIDKRGLR